MCPHAQIQFDSSFVEKKTRCVLVHDHVLIRQGLRRLLEDVPQVEVVAEAASAEEALRQVFEQQPDVVLADAGAMGLTAEDAERLILRESPGSRVFFILGSGETIGDLNISAVGEAGYVPPHTSAQELAMMLTGSSDPAPDGVRMMPRRNDSEWAQSSYHSKKRDLTARENEVLKLLAEGQTVRSAAGVLGLSAKTVDAHKFNLMRKLGIHNKAELVMWAIQKRVVKMPVNY